MVDNKLWTNVIDDMNSTEIWAIGGIIFLSRNKANAFIKDLRRFDEWKNSNIKIVELKINGVDK